MVALHSRFIFLSPSCSSTAKEVAWRMGRGRGVSYGGGQSSLNYLFGGGETPAVRAKPAAAADEQRAAAAVGHDDEKLKGVPAGVRGSQTNNYFRAQGQNCGNFLTDRPSTKVHAAPGGGSSLDYLFGGGSAAGGK